ncbi:hypothetical protein ABZ208_13950 [Streptomyces sp. NPDC006208]|uniref:hypothetical protein n=1 Tax=Streptomyces sp. NPDC006208 TaxID=3156734 RepID=UPI0033BD24A8
MSRRSPSLSPLPEHGTYARSVGRPAQGIRGCTCPLCRKARAAYSKRRRVLNETGRTLRVPAPPVAAHVRALLDSGSGWTYITRTSGSSSCTLNRLLNGQQSIKRTVADRIMAVQPEPQPTRRVPALPSTRRLRALLAIGHTINGSGGIVGHSGVDQTVLSSLITGRIEHILADTETRITAAYNQLADKPGTNDRNRRRAASNQWAGPDYWDDDSFPDPDFVPATRPTPKYIALGQNALELEQQQGYTREQAADRLGVTKDNLQQAITRYRRIHLQAAA